MQKLILSLGIAFTLSASIALAKGNPCPFDKANVKKQTKLSEKPINDKTLKSKPAAIEGRTKTLNQSKLSPDTFDSLIAPFIKTVSPHFYDHIIRREPRSNTTTT